MQNFISKRVEFWLNIDWGGIRRIRDGGSQLEQKSLDSYHQADKTQTEDSLDSDYGKEDMFGREQDESTTRKEGRKNYLE